MKIDIDDDKFDKLLEKRANDYKKTIRSLEKKLESRDKKIQKLNHELEKLKGDMMDTSKETAKKIALIAEALISEMKKSNWIEDDNCDHDCDTCHWDHND